jgi:hypothetical protein
MTSRTAYLFLLLGAAFVVALGCSRREPRDRFRDTQLLARDTIEAFARASGAIVPWAEADTGRSSETFYTIDLQNELDPAGGPVAFLASLWDVWRTGEVYYASFTEESWTYEVPPPYVIWELEVPPHLAEALLRERPQEFLDEYLVAADVVSIHRPRLGIRATGAGDEFFDVVLEPEFPDVFVVRGRLRGFRLARGGLRKLLDQPSAPEESR